MRCRPFARGLVPTLAVLAIGGARAQSGNATSAPRTWDDQAISALEIPLASPIGSPKHVSAEYYYGIPVAPIYKSYPVYARFIPGDPPRFTQLPDPGTLTRYSDEQLYALARYLYSLQPPPNPNRGNALTTRGQQVFQREGCGTCHTPPLYTNNKLTPADGFTIPEHHRQK